MSRRSRDVFFIGIALIVIAAVAADNIALKPLRRHIVESKQRGPDGKKYHLKYFTVVNVVDGDTFDIDISDGDSNVTRLRPLGIDTPETKHPKIPAMYYGQQAAKKTTELLLNNRIKIVIDTESPSRDHYGRLLCFVETEDGRDFGKIMIEEGYAYADLRFEHSRYDEYEHLQQQAVESKTGLWKEVTFDQLPKWLKDTEPGILE